MTSTLPTALILFAHGSRDPRWSEPLRRIAQLIEARGDDSVHVYQAYLELMTPTLPDLVAQLALLGTVSVHVVPIFLGQGAHVRSDLPAMIERLRREHPSLVITVADAVGDNDQVLQTIASVCVTSLPGPVG